MQKELLAEGTKFLISSPYTTLTIPGAAEKMITVASYNQENNTILSSSGRGYARNDIIQPIIAGRWSKCLNYKQQRGKSIS
ncbi:hypothetical protein R2R32_15525 [Clostridium perfringens]|nr:hypothetical protein [Clostridium perfringens]